MGKPNVSDVQGAIFLEGEGDRWFSRNAAVLASKDQLARDLPLRMLAQASSYRPRRVLEVGCSTGWRLAALRERYGCSVTGVEPSAAAIDEGKRLYGADFDLRRGLARALPIRADETFDLVIVAFVFHWVSRDAVLASVAEIDRALDDGGHLLVYDFFPDAPTTRPYHHLPDGDAYTYKQEVARTFLATNLYQHVGRLAAHHAGSPDLLTMTRIASGDRVVCDVLEKNVSLYANG